MPISPPSLTSKPSRATAWLAPGLLVLTPVLLFFPALFLNRWISGDDAQGLYWPLYAETARHLAVHQWPLWMPNLYGGMPGIASCNLMFLYPTDLLASLASWPFQRLLGLDAALHVALAGLGMFLFLRRLKLSRAASLLGAFFLALSGSEISQLYGGFYNFVEGFAWLPWAFWAAHKARWERSWASWGLCGLALALQILAGAAQLCSYTVFALTAFVLAPAWGPAKDESPSSLGQEQSRQVGLRTLAGLSLALGLALLLAAPQILPTLRYLPLSARQGFTHAAFVRGSIGLSDALAWLVPGFFGWQAPTYHGALRYGLTSEYFGLLPWFLAVAALRTGVRADARTRWWAGLILVAFFFAQGAWTPFYALIQRLPLLSGFHLWSRTLFLLTFAVCTLAAQGWDALSAPDSRKAALQAVFGFAGLALAAAALAWHLAPGKAALDAPQLPWLWSSPDGLHAAVAKLSGLARDSAWTTLELTLLAAALLWFASRRPGARTALVLALAFHLLDQSSLLTRFICFVDPASVVLADKFTAPPPPPPGLEPWRIYDEDQAAPDKDMLLGYDNLSGGETVPPTAYVRTIETLRTSSALWQRWLDLMGVRYVFVHSKRWPRLDGDTVTVYQNPGAFPRAWLAGQGLAVRNDQEARDLLASPGFDPKHTVTLDSGPLLNGPRPEGAVRWVQRSPQAFRLSVDTKQACYLVLSDAWYPAWKAGVDGQQVPVLKADGFLRALLLKPGTHSVDFWFDPGLFDLCLAACSIGLALLAGLLWRERKGLAS